jgi:predicted alpha/beta-hydrolase family hydrolase
VSQPDTPSVSLSIDVPDVGSVSGLLLKPDRASSLFVFGHGAGAGMQHAFMEAAVSALAARGIATLRYQFPYMEANRRAPDRAPRLIQTVRAAVEVAGRLAGDLPIFAGGKSMGGRMTSMSAAQQALPGVRGLMFFGFPLHGVGKPPSTDRGIHLSDVGLPMLFLQGTRDRLADLDLLRPLVADLRPACAVHVVDGADHGFHVLKRSGRTDQDVMDELADAAASWAATADRSP